MDVDYKTAKEAFVSHTTGSTVGHINLVSAVALCSLALHAVLRPSSFLVQWLVLVLPLLLSMTIAATRPLLLSGALITAAALVRAARTPAPRPALPSRAPLSPSHTIEITRQSIEASVGDPKRPVGAMRIVPLPALTTYRAHMMLMTVLAILAVDFPVFPRALAKCEDFGVSLMDLGVGSFVFSQGLVSATPILRKPSHLADPLAPKALRTLRKSVPVILLGVARVVLVKRAEYPEHESEYGTHWNFFFTLAVLPVLQTLLHPLIARVPVALVGICVSAIHQILLSMTSLQQYTLNAPRTGLISMNKEGLVSLTGYLAIHLLGLATGTLVLPSSPSAFRRRQRAQRRDSIALPPPPSRPSAQYATPDIKISPPLAPASPGNGNADADVRQDGKTAIELCAHALLWWALFGLATLLGAGGGVSRRLANLPYVLWTSAFNASFILGYMALDMACRGAGAGDGAGRAPALLEAINRNALVIFLVANLATGCVNMALATLHAPDARAMAVLCAYALGVCGVAWAWRGRRVW